MILELAASGNDHPNVDAPIQFLVDSTDSKNTSDETAVDNTIENEGQVMGDETGGGGG